VHMYCKLFPEADKKGRLKALINLLYAEKKYFKNYVLEKVRDELTPLIRMKVSRDIRKHFAAWKFLEVLDCSKQSLNQVRKN
jgi:hypothetical protein